MIYRSISSNTDPGLCFLYSGEEIQAKRNGDMFVIILPVSSLTNADWIHLVHKSVAHFYRCISHLIMIDTYHQELNSGEKKKNSQLKKITNVT